ncbi:MAG: sel1 repeat family protein [Alphaproteobacteria bacterium]|nr:sel1 repeat family protein [Alphaproteobacteria bacterium]
MGSLYYGGIGVKRSSQKAAILFRKAAELGNTDAAVSLGFMHASGNGATQDMDLALKYLEAAVTSDSPATKFMVGYAYYTGKYREINYAKAATLLKEAADAGFDEAQTIVANIFINGLGFPQNYNNGVKYLHKAVMQGNTKAMMDLADILVEGKKYNKDISYAHVLYNLAAVRGVTTAVAKRNSVEASMKIDEVLAAQQRAGAFKEELSPVTVHIRNTYGKSISSYFN